MGRILDVDWSSPLLWAQSITDGRIRAPDHLIQLDLALLHAAVTPNSRVIVEMPPRHGKSTLSSIYFPAWYRLRFPQRNIALWSATGRLAQRFSRHARNISRDMARQFGWDLDQTTKAWENWKLRDTPPACGEFYASGVGGGGTMGTGSHLLVVDDFFRDVANALSSTIRENQQEWFMACVQTRMEPGASIVIIATRWHRDDLIGFVLREAMQLGETWDRIRLPAINEEGKALWPERYPIEKLKRIKRGFQVQGYSWMFDALYQQEPPEVLDSEWDPSYFHDGIYFDHWPATPVIRIVVLDPSVGQSDKADYSAIMVMYLTADGHIWIEGDLAIRDVVQQVRAVCMHIKIHNVAVFGCEANAFQGVVRIPYEQEALRHGILTPFVPIYASKEKRGRIRSFISPHLAAGRLHFKRNSAGTNLALEQLRGFPSHEHIDGPDAIAMGIELLGQLMHGTAAQQEEILVT